MGFFGKIGKFFHGIGDSVKKAFGVITSPVRAVWGVVKDSLATVVHLPEKVLASFNKATVVVAGLGNNLEHGVSSAAGAVTAVGGDIKDVFQSPVMWGALGLAAFFVLRS